MPEFKISVISTKLFKMWAVSLSRIKTFVERVSTVCKVYKNSIVNIVVKSRPRMQRKVRTFQPDLLKMCGGVKLITILANINLNSAIYS
jgi:hypothetical protein